MEVILMNVGTFYVLYDTQARAFVQDSQPGRTDDVLVADQYPTLKEAKKERSYYKDEYKEFIKVMKITMTMSNT